MIFYKVMEGRFDAAAGTIGRGGYMSGSGEAKNAAIVAISGGMAIRFPEEPAAEVPLQGVSRPPEPTAPMAEHRNDQRSEACRTEPVAMPSIPELSPSAINTDVRRHGLNPFLTGVTVGIIACIIVFLLVFAYLVVSYMRYTNG
jgi:hypothetical protein